MISNSQKWGASARATCTNAPEMPLLYLDNHSADRAQVWYAHRDPLTKGCTLAKSGVCPHVRTCHVHNPQKSICYVSTTTKPIVLKFGTHIGTHHITVCNSQMWDACARAHAHKTLSNPHIISRKGSPEKRFTLVKGGVHSHVHTCHVQKRPRNSLAISRQPLAGSCSNLVRT